ncbi:DnaT-like ssDNA-binding domain-containing protein [Saccharospirillum mangrovi]|uniref:DnaT-like ssDNA-binding domain-containing protein n=1 Tax=Saccharospirillum mangrovi TaxID=2161747 RepID=UPI0013008062|nr:DnaT-like ssDNA-binding domain-containing protein [Saccharospirillum mangrovi]
MVNCHSTAGAGDGRLSPSARPSVAPLFTLSGRIGRPYLSTWSETSVIPEKVLVVSPALAETLGLEEALLYQLLSELTLMSGPSLQLTDAHRQRLLPFWSAVQVGSVLRRLQAQGLLEVTGDGPWQIQLADLAEPSESVPAVVSEPPVERVPVRRMNDARRRNQMEDELDYLKADQPPAMSVRAERSRMHADWEPSEDFPRLLSFHDIPITFALSELAKFRQYYQDRDKAEYSWDVRFLNWVQRAWHDQLNNKGRYERNQRTQESANPDRDKRAKVREALRNIRDTDW